MTGPQLEPLETAAMKLHCTLLGVSPRFDPYFVLTREETEAVLKALAPQLTELLPDFRPGGRYAP